MTLKAQAQQALAGLAAFAGDPETLHAADGNNQLTAELAALDALALSFNHLAVINSALANATIDQLKKVADALSKRITYLLEPISPIEIDANQCAIQLRSSPPQRDDNGSQYYELLVRRGGEIALRRYQKQPGGVRQPISAHVTREVFLRLVGDFSEVRA